MVTIKGIIQKIKEKRELKKAIETGKQLSGTGVTETTQQTTTGAYVTPSGEVEVSKGNVVIKTSGGGSRTTTQQTVTPTNQVSTAFPTQQAFTQQTSTQQLFQRQVTTPQTVMTNQGGVSTAFPTKYQTIKPTTQTVYGPIRYEPGTVYQHQVGTYRGVPVYETRVVQDTGESILATKEEIREAFPPELTRGEGPETKFGRYVGEKLGQTKQFLGEEFVPSTKFEEPIEEWGTKGGKARKVTSEIITGIIPTSKGEILSSVVSFGLGSLIGAGVRGGERAISLVSKQASKYTVPAYRGLLTAGGLYATGRYALGVSKQVKETGSFESVGEGFRDLALFGKGFKTGTKFTEKWTTPFTKELPIDIGKQFKEGKYLEKSVGIRDGQTLYDYTGFVERKPPVIKITTTKLRETFPKLLKPLKITSEQAKFSLLETIEPQARGGKSFKVKETVEGRKYTTIYEVGGKSVPRDLKQFNQLSKQEQLQWKRVTERALNRKVETKDVPRLLNQNIEKVRELTYSVKLRRVKLKGNTLEIKTPFKEGFKGFKPRIEISEGVSASKTVKTPSGEFEISQTFTGFNQNKVIDIIKTPSGEIELFPKYIKPTPKRVIKTTTIEKLGIDNLKDIGITEFKGGGKKSSEQFYKGLYQIQEQKISELPKPVVKIPKYKAKVITQQVSKQEPFMVGGKGLSIIPYSGQMTYEVQELGVSKLPGTKMNSLIFTGEIPTESTNEIIKVINKSGTNSRNKIDEIIKPVVQVKELTKPIEIIKPVEITKPIEITKPVEIIKPPIIKPPIIKPTIIKHPRIKEVIKPVVETNKQNKVLKFKRKKRLGEEEFLAITKRKGKEVVIGIAKTPKEAEMIAKKDVLGRLSATVKVKSTRGRQIQLTPNELFRQSKTDPLSLVQRKTARLSSLGERKEIKESRRRFKI